MSNFTTGDLRLNSSISYYEESVEYADSWMADAEAYGLTADEVEAIKLWKELSEFIATNVPNVDDSSADGVNAAYVGIESGGIVRGVFVYAFKEAPNFTDAQMDQINTIADFTNEYYYIKGKYLITAESSFLSGNNISSDSISTAVDLSIK